MLVPTFVPEPPKQPPRGAPQVPGAVTRFQAQLPAQARLRPLAALGLGSAGMLALLTMLGLVYTLSNPPLRPQAGGGPAPVPPLAGVALAARVAPPPSVPGPNAILPSAPPPVSARRAVDLLLAGRTRDARDIYRALAKQDPAQVAYQRVLEVLDREPALCSEPGSASCP